MQEWKIEIVTLCQVRKFELRRHLAATRVNILLKSVPAGCLPGACGVASELYSQFKFSDLT